MSLDPTAFAFPPPQFDSSPLVALHLQQRVDLPGLLSTGDSSDVAHSISTPSSASSSFTTTSRIKSSDAGTARSPYFDLGRRESDLSSDKPSSSNSASILPSTKMAMEMGAETEILRCKNCDTSATPLWRRAPDGSLNCNACALYQKCRGFPRPRPVQNFAPATRQRSKPYTKVDDCVGGRRTEDRKLKAFDKVDTSISRKVSASSDQEHFGFSRRRSCHSPLGTDESFYSPFGGHTDLWDQATLQNGQLHHFQSTTVRSPLSVSHAYSASGPPSALQLPPISSYLGGDWSPTPFAYNPFFPPPQYGVQAYDFSPPGSSDTFRFSQHSVDDARIEALTRRVAELESINKFAFDINRLAQLRINHLEQHALANTSISFNTRTSSSPPPAKVSSTLD